MVGGAVSVVVGGIEVVVVRRSLVVVRLGPVVVVDGGVVDVATVGGATSTTVEVVAGGAVVVVTTRLVVVGPELVVVGGRVVVVGGRVVVVGGRVVVVGGRVVVVGGRVVVVGGRVVVGRVVVVVGGSVLVVVGGAVVVVGGSVVVVGGSVVVDGGSVVVGAADVGGRVVGGGTVVGGGWPQTEPAVAWVTVSVPARRASVTAPSGAGARNHHEPPGAATPWTVSAPLSWTDIPTGVSLPTRHHRSVAPSTAAQADSSVTGPLAGSGQSTGSARAITSPPTTSRTAPEGRYQTELPLAVPVTEPPGVSSVATAARSPGCSVQAETSPPRRHPWAMLGSGGPGSSGWQTGPASSTLATVAPPKMRLAGLGPSPAGASSQVVPETALKVIVSPALGTSVTCTGASLELTTSHALQAGYQASGVHAATRPGAVRSGNSMSTGEPALNPIAATGSIARRHTTGRRCDGRLGRACRLGSSGR